MGPVSIYVPLSSSACHYSQLPRRTVRPVAAEETEHFNNLDIVLSYC